MKNKINNDLAILPSHDKNVLKWSWILKIKWKN